MIIIKVVDYKFIQCFAVVCPGYSFEDNTYCDCDSDCNKPMCSRYMTRHRFTCPEAQACCGNKGTFSSTILGFCVALEILYNLFIRLRNMYIFSWFFLSEEVFYPLEEGFCVTSNGQDQNSGVVKLNDLDGNTPESKKECLNLCKDINGATGCEAIWNQDNRGCYAHTYEVARGNGVDNHVCWVFSKYEQGITIKKYIN